MTTFFTDRDLGHQFPELLSRAGIVVERHDDHFGPNTPDVTWLREVGQRGWFVLTHDQRIRYIFIGLRPDNVIEVRADILGESDGPTLVHAIQRLHGSRIVLPARKLDRPDPTLVEKRYERFRASGG